MKKCKKNILTKTKKNVTWRLEIPDWAYSPGPSSLPCHKHYRFLFQILNSEAGQPTRKAQNKIWKLWTFSIFLYSTYCVLRGSCERWYFGFIEPISLVISSRFQYCTSNNLLYRQTPIFRHPFFRKQYFSLKYSLVSPPPNFWRYV